MDRARKRNHSMKSRLLLPMLAVVVLQALIYIGTVFGSNVFLNMERSSYNVLSNGTSGVCTKLERQLLDIRTATVSYAEKITGILQVYAARNGFRLDSAEALEEKGSALVEEVGDEVFGLLRSAGASGCFLILENGDLRKPALYIRDVDPTTIAANDADVMGVVGPAELLAKYQVALDSEWLPRLDLSHASAVDFYEEPFEAALGWRGLEAQDLGYWGGMARLTANDSSFFFYTVPLLDGEGCPYGILGVELSEKYLLSLLDYKTLGLEGSGALALCVGGEEDARVLLVNGPVIKRDMVRDMTLRFQEIKEDESVCRVRNSNFEKEMTGAVRHMHLYNTNTPFYNQSWSVVGIMESRTLLRDVYSLKNILLLDFFAALAAGIVIALQISHGAVKPLAELMVSLRSSDPSQKIRLKRTQMEEIDELAEVIEDLSADVAAAASHMSQIIDMVDMPIGAMEYDRKSRALFCSGGLFSLLDFPEAFQKGERMPYEKMIEEFGHFVDRIVDRKAEGEARSLVSIRVATGKRWLRFIWKDMEDVRLVVAQDVTQEANEMERLEYERDFDVLTNLLNRRAFEQRARQIMDSGEHPLMAAVMWDLDNLKFINDTYGHDYGDRYIQEAARVFGQLGEGQALVCRRSGDEFVALVYSEKDKEGYRRAVEEVRSQLAATAVVTPDQREIKVRASGGLAWYPEDGADYSELMKYMDFAMYDAKHREKGSLREFDRRIYERDQLLLSGTEALNELLEQEKVRYAFQPIVSTEDGSVFAYEALMRPQVKGLQSPADVMRLASSQSKMYQIERLTWRCALRDFSALAGDSQGGSRLFVNSVPNTHLTEEDSNWLLEEYKELFPLVVMEMIESEQQDPESLSVKRHYREEHKIQIALDDFGTGYSTEGVLLEIKPEYVKIDISIISGIEADHDRQTLLANLVSFCKPRGIKIIAEGVETREEMAYLIRAGVDLLQGYYLGRPEFELREVPEECRREIRMCRESI